MISQESMNVLTEIYNKDLRNRKFFYICAVIGLCVLLVGLVARNAENFRNQIYQIERSQGTVFSQGSLRDIKKLQDKKKKESTILYHKLCKEDRIKTDFSADYELLRLSYRYKDNDLAQTLNLTSDRDRLYYINRVNSRKVLLM